MIPWTPIDQIPEALKDGRPVLLWVDGACLDAVFYSGLWRRWSDWSADFVPLEGAITHFAEINAPDESGPVKAEGLGNLRQRFYPAFGMMATFDQSLPSDVAEFRDPQTGALLASTRPEDEQ